MFTDTRCNKLFLLIISIKIQERDAKNPIVSDISAVLLFSPICARDAENQSEI